ncbi:MAG: hypothetical protein PHN90_08290 [Methanothrix sp.]|jgi:hypothetical protein|nr:hypothetical protein [Methanothrix sp.]
MFHSTRWKTKQFFLYSYHLFRRFSEDDDDIIWKEYQDRYANIFLRDPSNDYYGYRSPIDLEKGWINSLEWSNIFEIVNLVGYPYNESAKNKMLKYAKIGLRDAIKSPGESGHDFMLCSAVACLPDEFSDFKDPLLRWIDESVDFNKLTLHQITAYLNVVKMLTDCDHLKNKLTNALLSNMESVIVNDTPRRQILVWARLSTRLDWYFKTSNTENLKTFKEYLFNNLYKVRQLDWNNTPIILEAAYYLSDVDKKEAIRYEIARNLTPSIFFKLKDIFRFLNEYDELQELQSEVESIKEKCTTAPSRETCRLCMTEPQGECWIRILSKITGRDPWTHGPFEVADVVIYALERGIYFVIKAEPITKQRGEGDVLHRQCTTLLSNDHALVLYWNPFDTAPMVVENIRKIASSMSTNSRFEVVDKKYVRQIYKSYKSKYSKDVESISKKDVETIPKNVGGKSLFDF